MGVGSRLSLASCQFSMLSACKGGDHDADLHESVLKMADRATNEITAEATNDDPQTTIPSPGHGEGSEAGPTSWNALVEAIVNEREFDGRSAVYSI